MILFLAAKTLYCDQYLPFESCRAKPLDTQISWIFVMFLMLNSPGSVELLVFRQFFEALVMAQIVWKEQELVHWFRLKETLRNPLAALFLKSYWQKTFWTEFCPAIIPWAAVPLLNVVCSGGSHCLLKDRARVPAGSTALASHSAPAVPFLCDSFTWSCGELLLMLHFMVFCHWPCLWSLNVMQPLYQILFVTTWASQQPFHTDMEGEFLHSLCLHRSPSTLGQQAKIQLAVIHSLNLNLRLTHPCKPSGDPSLVNTLTGDFCIS